MCAYSHHPLNTLNHFHQSTCVVWFNVWKNSCNNGSCPATNRVLQSPSSLVLQEAGESYWFFLWENSLNKVPKRSDPQGSLTLLASAGGCVERKHFTSAAKEAPKATRLIQSQGWLGLNLATSDEWPIEVLSIAETQDLIVAFVFSLRQTGKCLSMQFALHYVHRPAFKQTFEESIPYSEHRGFSDELNLAMPSRDWQFSGHLD